MAAGEYRHPVEFQEQRLVQDPDTGELRPMWVTVARVWAAVEDLSGREFWAAALAQSEVTSRVRIRYRPDVRPTMRVLHEGRTFEITHVMDPDGRRRELHVMCKRLQ